MKDLFVLALSLTLFACGEPVPTDPVSPTAPAAAPVAQTTPVSTTGSTLDFPESEPADITVTIKGAPAGNVRLIGQYTDQQYAAAQAPSDANGTVRFSRDEPYDPGFYYAYYEDGTAAQMLISEDQTFRLTADKSDVAGTMKVDGSLDNELLYEGIRYERSQQPRFQAAKQDLAATQALAEERQAHFEKVFAENPNTFYTSFKRAGQNPTFRDVADDQEKIRWYRKDFFNTVDFRDPRLLRTPVIANKLKRYVKELTPQVADSIIASTDALIARARTGDPEFFKYIANYVTLEYEPGKSAVMDADAIHVHMIRNYFNREVAFWADSMTVFGLQQRADQMANSLVGQQGVNIKVPGVDGEPKALYDEDAPYVIVYMYNPDCDHCQEQTPKLVDWHQRNKNRADVYAVALDTEDDKWRKFIRDYGTGDWTNVYDPTNRSIFKTYYVDNTPELYLLDKDRKIVAKNIKAEQLDEAIRLLENG